MVTTKMAVMSRYIYIFIYIYLYIIHVQHLTVALGRLLQSCVCPEFSLLCKSLDGTAESTASTAPRAPWTGIVTLSISALGWQRRKEAVRTNHNSHS